MDERQIQNLEDIKMLVDTFYGRIRKDELLAPIFNERIQDRWPEHLEKMYRFWQTMLLNDHTYFGSPFFPHASLDVYHQHFDRWLSLWKQTLNELYTGDRANEALWRAERMATMFEYKIGNLRQNEKLQS